MAELMAGGSILGAFLQVLFDRIASRELLDFFRGQKLTVGLLQKLNTMLIFVNGVLDDAEEKQITKSSVRLWLDELKDAVYEADDLLDEVSYESLRSELEVHSPISVHQVRNLFVSLNPFKRELEAKLGDVLERLEYLVNQRDGLGLREGGFVGRNALVSSKLPSTSLVDESGGVYGRDDDREAIMKLLLENVNGFGVIPIVGMGGVGKTTLAQLVYNDRRVEGCFDVKAWVCVSQESSVPKVTKDILNEVMGGGGCCDGKSLNQLQLELKGRLKGKKFFIVLDDVWNDKYVDWDVLRQPLMTGASGSKIIVTSRNQSVASIMQTVPVYHLKGLSNDDAWFLFLKHASHGGSDCLSPILEPVGKEIASKCRGLPLAAKTLGGLMRSNRDLMDWERICKSNLWDLSNDEILPAIRLSYHYLPSHLKRCFAYCAIFPKDYEFEKDELVYLWMAEGFIVQPRGNKQMEELGDDYFHDLVSRSFFQRSSSDPFCYVMHDLINDLAKHVSGDFCLRLECDYSCKIDGRTRHLSYARTECDLSQKLESLREAKLLRTFWLLEWSYFVSDSAFDLLMTRNRLRVLSLSHFRTLTELPDSIGQLKHLRYLNLSTTSVQRLPETVCGLYNLQTLILHQCNQLVQLPTNLGSLFNLRHLDIRGTDLQEMPLQMDKLTKLQLLTDFIIGRGNGSSIKVMGGLQNLGGQLCLRNLQHIIDVQDASEANLKEKKQLKQLEFVWDGDTHDSVHERTVLDQLQPHTSIQSLSIVGYRGTRFPDWVGSCIFSSITSLKLSGSHHCSTLPPLGQLVSLIDLSITAYVSVETVGHDFYGSSTAKWKKPFGSLKSLRFESMLSWREWIPFEGEAFPLLKNLYLRNCPNLMKALPCNLPCLEVVEVVGCQQLEATFPKAPNILKMSIKDDTRDAQLVKLPSKQHALSVDRFTNIESLLEAMEQMGGGISSTMERIEIKNCGSLRSFPLELFPNLRALFITRCCNLGTLSASGVTNSNYPSLTCLEIRNCPKLVSLLQGILPAPNLTRLLLMGCTGVECFPDERLLPSSLTILKMWDFPDLMFLDCKGLGNLRALKELEICNCPNLQCLPEGLPSALSQLCISWCPMLEQRCQPDGGEDWPKISHIPQLEVNFQKVTSSSQPSA
ncbi:Putative disease resistance RPP13-like protein 1 [Linum grandiflorum]